MPSIKAKKSCPFPPSFWADRPISKRINKINVYFLKKANMQKHSATKEIKKKSGLQLQSIAPKKI